MGTVKMQLSSTRIPTLNVVELCQQLMVEIAEQSVMATESSIKKDQDKWKPCYLRLISIPCRAVTVLFMQSIKLSCLILRKYPKTFFRSTTSDLGYCTLKMMPETSIELVLTVLLC